MKFSIVVDSACDVARDIVDGVGTFLSKVPINLQLGDKVYRDDEELNLDTYIDEMEASPSVKTSAPSPGLFLDRFKVGDSVFVVTLSSKLSATYQSAMTAKDMYIEQFGNKFIHIFDSCTASVGEGVIVRKITELLDNGFKDMEVVEKVDEFIKNMNTYIILDKFDNLVKTGRINPMIAKVAGFMNLKPICSEQGGEIKMLEKTRGFTKAKTRLAEIIRETTPDIAQRTMCITHVKALDKALALKDEMLRVINPKEIIIEESGGVTTTYGARGGLIVAV